MEEIIFKSKTYNVIRKDYKGKALGWKDIDNGDKICMEIKLENNSACGKVYQVNVKVIVETMNNIFHFWASFSKLDFMLSYFELEEI